MSDCDLCGGCGILNVWWADSADDLGVDANWSPAASPCHACSTGLAWEEVLRQ